MDFQTLQTAFYNRGFQDWNDGGTQAAEAKRLLNEAMHQLNDEQNGQWPFLEASTTSNAPVTIADLGTVESVWDATNSRWLVPADRRVLSSENWDGALTGAGAPSWFYVSNGVVRVYPVQVVSLVIRYWKIASDLSANGDTPLMPARYHGAIVDLAVAAAHRLNNDEGAAQAAQGEAQRKLDLMSGRLLGGQQVAGPVFTVPYSGED